MEISYNGRLLIFLTVVIWLMQKNVANRANLLPNNGSVRLTYQLFEGRFVSVLSRVENLLRRLLDRATKHPWTILSGVM